MSEKECDFGFKKVKKEEKAGLVRGVFDSVASKYDLMNDLMSAGTHRIWKKKMVEEIKFQDNLEILDMAGGTGDIAFRIDEAAKKLGYEVNIEVADINHEMLKVGQDRAIDKNHHENLKFVNMDAQNLAYEDEKFDYYTIAFGIRNVTKIDEALKEAYRVLKPGGKFICLEFSKVQNPILAKIYELYSFNVIPKIGKITTNDEDAYQYLVESIEKFPNQEKFKQMIEAAGFENSGYKNLTNGCVAIHVGFKGL